MRANGIMPSCQGSEGPVASLSSGCGDWEQAWVPEHAGEAWALFPFPLCLWKPEEKFRDTASSLGKDFLFILCWWDRDKVLTLFYQKCGFLGLSYLPCGGNDWFWCLLVTPPIFPALAQPSWDSIHSWEGRKALSTSANHCPCFCKVSCWRQLVQDHDCHWRGAWRVRKQLGIT